jgi:hypothetical protein
MGTTDKLAPVIEESVTTPEIARQREWDRMLDACGGQIVAQFEANKYKQRKIYK